MVVEGVAGEEGERRLPLGSKGIHQWSIPRGDGPLFRLSKSWRTRELPHYISSRQLSASIFPSFEQMKQIPKIIHQTYSTKLLPEAFKNNQASLKRQNPDWEYKFYDDADVSNFIGEHYGPTISNIYNKINPTYGAAKADLFRYLLIYKTGGVYLDIKSACKQPLNDLVRQNDKYLLSHWNMNGPGEIYEGYGFWPELSSIPGGEFQQWHIIAVAGHPFLKAVIEIVLANISRYNPWSYGVGREGVIRTTGPVAYTQAIYPILDSFEHRLLSHADSATLQYSVLDKLDHTKYFKKHYLYQTDEIIASAGWKHIFSKNCASCIKLKTKLRRNIGQILKKKSNRYIISQ